MSSPETLPNLPHLRPLGDGDWIHREAAAAPHLPPGPIVRLSSGELLSAARTAEEAVSMLWRSNDEGKTWTRSPAFPGREDLVPGPSGALACTQDGAVVFAFYNKAERHAGGWDAARQDWAAEEVILPCVVARSTDGGRSWASVQTLHRAWTGATRDMIQMRSGRLVFTSMMALRSPGRHGSLTYASDDDGRSWQASNVLDFGGVGDHDGIMEGTLAEVEGGGLLQYLRTTWDHFAVAFSADGGLHWHICGPSAMDTASVPAMLKRLQSGRLALVWHRLLPQRTGEADWKGGRDHRNFRPASNHREELSVALSEDDGETWSEPVVVACRPEGKISYPCVFEPRAGTLWITTWLKPFAVEVPEAALLG